ncbi:hypothetical protein [Streptomyces sp. NPDC058989]|uniref:hypothetical protein n=1 Tax=Streptomyces sp. NPDC058989 TaxID=3346686 RepID=UPI0036BFDC6A
MCTGYLVLLAVVFGGLQQPDAKPAPGKAGPLPGHTAGQEPGVPDDARPSAPAHTSGPAVPVGHHATRAPVETRPAP